jgi:hypothetical protein|tara:strand:- start:296 stop:487 length:192 start_codon:yes stop_codon:yes gene_type:complete
MMRNKKMIEVDLGSAVVQELAGLKRVERKGDKIDLVFEGIKGNEVYICATAMRDGDTWSIINV